MCYSSIAVDKALFFNQKVLLVFLFFYENICCGTSMSTHNKGFHREIEIRKILCGYPLLSVAMISKVILCCMLCLVSLQIIDPICLPATPNFPANINLVSVLFLLFLNI